MNRMAVIRLQSSYMSFLSPPSFFSHRLPLTLPRPLLRTCHFRTYFLSTSSYLHLQMLSSKIGEQGSLCSSIFFSALTGGHCIPRGRVGSIRYVDYHRPLLRCLLSAFSGRVLSLTAGVNYLP